MYKVQFNNFNCKTPIQVSQTRYVKITGVVPVKYLSSKYEQKSIFKKLNECVFI